MVIEQAEVQQKPFYPTTPLGETVINFKYLSPLMDNPSTLSLVSCQGRGDLEKLSVGLVEFINGGREVRVNHYQQYVIREIGFEKFGKYDDNFLTEPPVRPVIGILEIPHLIDEQEVGNKLLDVLDEVSKSCRTVSWVALSVYWPNITRAEMVGKWRQRGAQAFYLEPRRDAAN